MACRKFSFYSNERRGWELMGFLIAHVAGLVAYLISREGNRSPAAMSARLTALGVKGAVSGVRKSPSPFLAILSPMLTLHLLANGTPNVLARNDF